MTKRRNKKPQRTWAEVVLAGLKAGGQAMTLSSLNAYVAAHGRELVARNPQFWQAKVRQVVQRLRDQGLAENVSKGVWRATPATRAKAT